MYYQNDGIPSYNLSFDAPQFDKMIQNIRDDAFDPDLEPIDPDGLKLIEQCNEDLKVLRKAKACLAMWDMVLTIHPPDQPIDKDELALTYRNLVLPFFRNLP